MNPFIDASEIYIDIITPLFITIELLRFRQILKRLLTVPDNPDSYFSDQQHSMRLFAVNSLEMNMTNLRNVLYEDINTDESLRNIIASHLFNESEEIYYDATCELLRAYHLYYIEYLNL